MTKFLAALIFGKAPYSARYCERDGSICDSEARAEELHARIDRMRGSLISTLH